MPHSDPKPRLAYFISPHGYGHAARSAAVMAALCQLDPAIRFEIFTTVPPWFFKDSIGDVFNHHSVLTDIGLVQKDSLTEDLPETLRRLEAFLPFDPAHIDHLAGQVKQRGCQLVICDIAPMGLAVARAAGLPGMLVENFTWDWIYQGYKAEYNRIGQYIVHLQELFNIAAYRIQTEPLCDPRPVDLTTMPISRLSRTPAFQIRQRLDIPPEAQLVLLDDQVFDDKFNLNHKVR